MGRQFASWSDYKKSLYVPKPAKKRKSKEKDMPEMKTSSLPMLSREEIIDLIEEQTCPICRGEIECTGGWATSWGEESTPYFCEFCNAEFTVSRCPGKPDELDTCLG